MKASWLTRPKRFDAAVAYQTERLMLTFASEVVSRLDDHLNRSELARRIGVDRSAISRMLSGNPNLTVKTMAAVATALGCELNLSFQPSVDAAARFAIFKRLHGTGAETRTANYEQLALQLSNAASAPVQLAPAPPPSEAIDDMTTKHGLVTAA